MQRLNRRQSRRLDGEPESGGEADRPQHAQMVLLETRCRIANGSYQAPLEILPAAGIVDHLAAERVAHQRVDGEVPAQDVLARIRFETDTLGVAAIVVRFVTAKRNYLNGLAAVRHQHDPKLRSHLLGPRPQRQHLVRTGVGGNVVIFGVAAEQRIPHAAAHEPSLEAVRPESGDDGARQRRAAGHATSRIAVSNALSEWLLTPSASTRPSRNRTQPPRWLWPQP